MCHLGYLISSVTVVTSLLMHSRLLCGRGLEDRAAAAERKKEGHWELYHSNILAKSFLKDPDCNLEF